MKKIMVAALFGILIPFIAHHNNKKQYRNLCFHIHPLVLKQKGMPPQGAFAPKALIPSPR